MAILDFKAGKLLPHGIVGNMLLRRWGDKVILSAVPDYSKRKATVKQKAGRERFKLQTVPAARELLADPKERAACRLLAEEKHWPIWNAAISRASRIRS